MAANLNRKINMIKVHGMFDFWLRRYRSLTLNEKILTTRVHS